MPRPTPEAGRDATVPETINQSETKGAYLHFYPLPHYEDDRRSDTRARGELATVLPYTDDYEDKVRLIVLPGWYAVEERADGKIKQKWVLEIEPDERTIAAERASAPATDAGSIAELVRTALDEQRVQFEETIETLRDELAARSDEKPQPEKSMAEQLRETLEAAKALNEYAGQRANGAREIDPFDQVMKLFDRVNEVQERIKPSAIVDPAAGNIEKFLSLADRAIKEAPRVVAAWCGKKNGASDDDDGGDEMTAEDYANDVMNYALERLIADEPISFTDEPFAALALNAPAVWEQFLSSLRIATPQMLIAHFSDSDEFPAWYASALKARHAPRWVEKNLIEPARTGEKRKAPRAPASQPKEQGDQ